MAGKVIYPEFWGKCIEPLPDSWYLVELNTNPTRIVRARKNGRLDRSNTAISEGMIVRVAMDEFSNMGLVIKVVS